MSTRSRAAPTAAADTYPVQSGASSKTATIKCKECTFTKPATRMSDVIRHYKQMHASDDRRAEMSYTCDNDGCGFKNLQRSSVESHVFIHTREKPFHCDLCNASSADTTFLSKPCPVANVNSRNRKIKHTMAEPFDRAAFMEKHAMYFERIAPPARQATDEEKLSWVVWLCAEHKSLKAGRKNGPSEKSKKMALAPQQGRKETVVAEDASNGLQVLFEEEDRQVTSHPASTVTPADAARTPLSDSMSVSNVEGKGIPRRSNIHSHASIEIENASLCEDTRPTVDAPLVYDFDSPVGRTVYNAWYFTQSTTRTIYDARHSINRRSKYYSGSLMDSLLRSDDSSATRPMKPLPASPFRIYPRRSPSPPPVLHRDSYERTVIRDRPENLEAAATTESNHCEVIVDDRSIAFKTSTTGDIESATSAVLPPGSVLQTHDNLDVEEAAQGLLELARAAPLLELVTASIPSTDAPPANPSPLPSKDYHGSERAEVALALLQLGRSGDDVGSNVRVGTPSTVVGAPSPAETQTLTVAAGSPTVLTDSDDDHYDSACKEYEKTATKQEFAEKV